MAQRDQSSPGIAFGQVDRSARVVRHRGECAAALALGDVLQIAAGSARLLEVADGEQDLDVGGEQRRAPQRLGGLAQRPPQRGSRCLALALRKAQQRGQAGLAAAPAGLAVGLLGGTKLTPQEVDLAAPVRRMAGDSLVQDPLGVALGTADLHHRV